MSHNHREYGHFSEATQTALRRMYTHVCAMPGCKNPAKQCDHIFPLNFAEYADLFDVVLHAIENGWILCDRCHDKKSIAENSAYPDYAQMSKVYNRYWKLAFTPSGVRRVKEVNRDEINRKGQRAKRNYIVQGNRIKVALKNAKKDNNRKEIDRLSKALKDWQERSPRNKSYRKRAAE